MCDRPTDSRGKRKHTRRARTSTLPAPVPCSRDSTSSSILLGGRPVRVQCVWEVVGPIHPSQSRELAHEDGDRRVGGWVLVSHCRRLARGRRACPAGAPHLRGRPPRRPPAATAHTGGRAQVAGSSSSAHAARMVIWFEHCSRTARSGHRLTIAGRPSEAVQVTAQCEFEFEKKNLPIHSC